MYKRNWLVYTDYYGFKSVLVVYGMVQKKKCKNTRKGNTAIYQLI